MFKNKWRKRAFYIWVVGIPASIIFGILKNLNLFYPMADYLFIFSIVVNLFGLVLLKIGGRPEPNSSPEPR